MKRGTAVLTPFPFTDLSGQKVRPAVTVSRTNRPGRDVVLAFITSQRGASALPTDLSIPDSHPDFPLTGLKVSSVVKCDKLVTVDAAVLLGELGELSSALKGQGVGSLFRSLTSETTPDPFLFLRKDRGRLGRLKANARGLGRPRAAFDVAERANAVLSPGPD